MKKKRHSPEQIVRKLREAEASMAAGSSIGQVCQALEISEPTYHRWKKKYGGLDEDEAKRLKALEEENARLKRLVADKELDILILKEAAKGNF